MSEAALAESGARSGDAALAESGARSGDAARGRRGLMLAVLGCSAAAGVALLATARPWWTQSIAQPAPLPAITATHTGAALVPAAPALAAVAAAAAVALLATRSWGRLVVGAILIAAGLGTAGTVVIAVASQPHVAGVWPAVCMAAGLAIAAVGAVTLRRGRSWPGMSMRYERPAAPGQAAARGVPVNPTHLWDAIEHGDDPTMGDDPAANDGPAMGESITVDGEGG